MSKFPADRSQRHRLLTRLHSHCRPTDSEQDHDHSNINQTWRDEPSSTRLGFESKHFGNEGISLVHSRRLEASPRVSTQNAGSHELINTLTWIETAESRIYSIPFGLTAGITCILKSGPDRLGHGYRQSGEIRQDNESDLVPWENWHTSPLSWMEGLYRHYFATLNITSSRTQSGRGNHQRGSCSRTARETFQRFYV